MEGRGAGAGPAVLESREDDVELHHAAECSDDDDDSCTKEDEFEKIEGKTREPNNVVALTHGMVGVYTKVSALLCSPLIGTPCRYPEKFSTACRVTAPTDSGGGPPSIAGRESRESPFSGPSLPTELPRTPGACAVAWYLGTVIQRCGGNGVAHYSHTVQARVLAIDGMVECLGGA
jgi:hypothetical protein